MIQTKIFAQNGVLRAFYKYNHFWNVKENYNYEYFSKLLGNKVNEKIKDEQTPKVVNDLKNLLIREETTCDKTKYINPLTKDCYGVGSRCWIHRAFEWKL